MLDLHLTRFISLFLVYSKLLNVRGIIEIQTLRLCAIRRVTPNSTSNIYLFQHSLSLLIFYCSPFVAKS